MKAHNNICLVYPKLNVLSDGYKLSFSFGGPIALHGLVHFLNTTGPSLTIVVYAYFDRYWQPFLSFSWGPPQWSLPQSTLRQEEVDTQPGNQVGCLPPLVKLNELESSTTIYLYTYSAHSKLALSCIGYVVILNRCTMCSPSQAASLSLWNLHASWPKHQWSQLPQDTGTFKLWGTPQFSNIPATWNILTLYDLIIEGHTVFVAELCFPDAYVKRGSKSPIGPWIYVPTGRHIRNGKMGEPGSLWVFQSKRLYEVIE